MAFIPCNIGGGDSSTPITPSNSSPVALTANTSVKPTTNGYAIASYDSVTPSSTPESVASGDIVKIGGSGVIVDAIPTPTSITPSNSNPVPMYANTAYEPTVRGIAIADFINAVPSNSSPQSLVSGNIYKSQGNGYGIESYNSITPSNSSPVSLTSGEFYKPSASGYAISSYSSKTPSDTSPASVSSGAIIKASSSGYLVKNTPVNLGAPDIVSQANMSANSSRNITVTKTPRYVIFLMIRNSDSTGRSYGWCYDVQNSQYEYFNYTADGYGHTEDTGTLSNITVTSSSVTVTNTTAATCRTHVLIYY